MKDHNGIKECLTDSKQVREMIINNPDLPLIFLCGEECWTDEFGYLVNIGHAEIQELTLYKEMLTTREDLEERLGDDLFMKELNEEENEKIFRDELAMYVFKKAITVTLG
jgi:hypothetical protein